MKKIILAVCLLFVSLSINASLLPYVTLAWDANSEPELKGYSIYIQEDDGSFTWIDSWDETELVNPLLPQVTIQGLQPRDFYYFVATAYSETEESDFSEDACGKLIPGYDHYVDCDFQENQPNPGQKKGGGGGSACFISTIF
jgi:hypothetical protein